MNKVNKCSVKEVRDFFIFVLKDKINSIKKANKNDLVKEISQSPELMKGLIDWITDDDEPTEPTPSPQHNEQQHITFDDPPKKSKPKPKANNMH